MSNKSFLEFLETKPPKRRAAPIQSADYYIAYGSNLNLEQMKYRCPNAIAVGKATVEGWKLVFRFYADIERSEDSNIEVGIFKITADCERRLDRYEGFPTLYKKEYIETDFGTALVYTMTDVEDNGRDYGAPTEEYFQTVRDGHADFNLDTGNLFEALEEVAEVEYI